MALQLKRGTNAARQLIIQEEGELFYTTDTQQIYAGDGSTPGGNPISNSESNATALAALTDTDLASVYDGQILAFNSFSNKWEATSTFTGDVYSDDSSILIDSSNNLIVGNINNTDIETQQLTINNNSGGGINVNGVTSGTSGPNMTYTAVRESIEFPVILSAGDTITDIVATGHDGVDTATPSAVIKLGIDKYCTPAENVLPGRILFLTYNEDGSTGLQNAMVFNRLGNLGIKNDDPEQAVDVNGNIKASGFIQSGSYADNTARDADITVPAAGMMIFNVASTKFQGYTGVSWVDLH